MWKFVNYVWVMKKRNRGKKHWEMLCNYNWFLTLIYKKNYFVNANRYTIK